MPLAHAQRRGLYIRWILVAVTVGLGIGLFFLRGRPPQAGDIIRAPFTLLPKDKDASQCALPDDVRDHRCRFRLDRKGNVRMSRLPRAGTWAPYWTTDRMLYVVDGLFEQPEVIRVAAEKMKLPERDRRFVAECRVKLVRWLQDGKVRFNTHARWDPHIPNWQVEVVDCDAG